MIHGLRFLFRTMPGALLALTLTLGFLSPASAQEDAETVFELSGLATAFLKGPETMAEVAHDLGLGTPYLTLWEQSAQETFAPDILEGTARAAFVRELDPGAVAPLVAFWKSPLGRALSAAEAEANILDTDERDARDAAAQAVAAQFSQTRHAHYDTIAGIITVPDLDEHLALIVEAMITPLYPPADVEMYMVEVRGALSEDVEETWKNRVILLLEDFSDAEVEAFVDHLETPAGREFYRASAIAEVKAVSTAVEAIKQDFTARVEGL